MKNYGSNTNINTRTRVVLPITIVVACVISFGGGLFVFGWDQFQRHKEYDIERFAHVYETIESRASDRYTGHEAEKFAESVKQRFDDNAAKNDAEHRLLQRQIDRNASDISRNTNAISAMK